jgi:hypothetical protein
MEEDFFRSLEAEDLRLLNGYDEARRGTPRATLSDDINELVKDYDSAKAIKGQLDALNYFGSVIARYGSIEAWKNFDFEKRDKSVFGQDWFEQGFKEISLYFVIESSRGKIKSLEFSDKILRIRIMVYGKSGVSKAENLPSYYWHEKKSYFPAKAIPVSWPGPSLLAASLDPEVRKRASELVGEAYGKFLSGLLPPAPDIETMHTISGWDEARTALPRTTVDTTPILKDPEETKKVEDRLKAANYFDSAFTRSSEITVQKYFKPGATEKDFRSARLYMRIGLRRGRSGYRPALHIETDISGTYAPGEDVTYRPVLKKDYPASEIPAVWPGYALTSPSLVPEVRKKVSVLFAEAYKVFLKALSPPPPDIETMHTISNWDEAIIGKFEAPDADSKPFSMWSNTDKYVPVGSEEDRELLYGIEESEESEATVGAFLAVGKLMESIKSKTPPEM